MWKFDMRAFCVPGASNQLLDCLRDQMRSGQPFVVLNADVEHIVLTSPFILIPEGASGEQVEWAKEEINKKAQDPTYPLLFPFSAEVLPIHRNSIYVLPNGTEQEVDHFSELLEAVDAGKLDYLIVPHEVYILPMEVFPEQEDEGDEGDLARLLD